jgi:diguanylate cyclase (GGDEF)-like protein
VSGRDLGGSDPPRLVLRFAAWTGIGLALAAAAILLVIRHFDTVQAERSATAQARVLASTVLRASLTAADFRSPDEARREKLDDLFSNRVLEEGFLLASLVAADGTISYSTDHRLIGSRIEAPDHAVEARRGIVRGDVASAGSGDDRRKSLRTYAPVAVPGGTGVVVIHQDYAPIARAANATFLPVAGIFEAVLALLFVALVPILRRVSVRIRRQMEEIQRRAHYDDLTGLPNRTLFRLQLETALGAGAVVLLLDVDHFKEVNDALGHERGDELLEAIGRRLADVEQEASVARLGGDEFALLLPHASLVEAEALAARIHGALERPFELGGFSLEVGASVGIAAFGEHGEDADALLQHADVAMYLAKRAHAGTAVYSAEQDTNDAERLALAAELRRAIEQEQLAVHYQPKADLASGRIVGVEALVRWIHPKRGFVPPDTFVPLAERTGLIKPLSRHVLRAAVEQCAAWAADGLDLHVAVNLTIPDLLDLELPDRVAALLADTGVPADRLELEVTESTILADPHRVRKVIDRLSELGVGFAIDDFGTGYSSLAYLKQLPVQTIKIDRSFVFDMLESESDAAIVRSTVDLARNLGLRVVAEGVETQEMWDALREQGCTLAQGYLVSKPVPADALAGLLAARGARLAAPPAAA